MPNADHRRELGRLGETAAAAHLIRLGHRILVRNFRTRFGELDLVSLSEDTLVFTEVKSRRSRRRLAADQAWMAIDWRKQRQVRAIAQSFLNEPRARPYTSELRFDAIAVTINVHGEVVALDHIEHAF